MKNIVKKNLTVEKINKLNNVNALEEVGILIKAIDEADIAYHKNDDPKISDADYDSLKVNLNLIHKKFPKMLMRLGYRKLIGAEVAPGFEKIQHHIPMLSLSNGLKNEDIYNFETSVRKFLGLNTDQTIQFTSEPKIDGLSLSLRYEGGILIEAVTRGDGNYGENVTNNALTIKDIPKRIKSSMKVFEVRGEVYMRRSDFSQLNETQTSKGNKIFANPRNAAAGSLRQLDSKRTEDRKLAFFAYAWGYMSSPLSETQFDSLQKLRDLGFQTNPLTELCGAISELFTHYNEIMLARADLDYDIDGVVYKINNLDYQRRLGFRSTTPRWAIAHKFPAESAVTQVLDIEVQVGRTGSLSPVARLKPINIGGVIVSNATLHNEDYIAGWDSSGSAIRDGVDIRIKDWVEVYRAGDVIPKIKCVILSKRGQDTKRYIFPKNCPNCTRAVVKEDGDSVTRCSGGILCPAQAVEKLKHFVSRKAFNIVGFGKKIVEVFYVNKFLRNPSDIFFLEENYGPLNLIKLEDEEGWGGTSAAKLFKSIHKSRNISLARLIYALGIRHIGEQAASLLAKHYKSWDNFYQQICMAKNKETKQWSDLSLIDGLGDIMVNSLLKYFSSEESDWVVSSLISELTIESYSIDPTLNSQLTDRVIAFTGSLKKMTRSEAKSRAEELGAKVTNSITQNTNLLVAGENSGSKLKKASDLAVKVISEEEWVKLIKGNE